MNSDYMFKIGFSHKECQDYAIINSNKLAISDGCSGAPMTDIGSRLISISSINNLNSLYSKEEAKEYLNVVGLEMINNANSLKLPLDCLCATLLNVIKTENGYKVLVVGDGVVVAKSDTNIIIYDYVFDVGPEKKGIPYYLIYNFNESIKDQYFNNYSSYVKKNFHVLNNDGIVIESGSESIDFNRDNFFFLEDISEEYHTVSVYTDGIKSFVHKDNIPIDFVKLAYDFNNFKSYNGKFVSRRVNKQLNLLLKDGLNHFDDFTMASLSKKDF